MGDVNRSKFAYLTYADMIDKLNNGILDAYDRVICTDLNYKQYIISPDLVPTPLSGEETDPTVPLWAKNPIKPNYNDVGAVNRDDMVSNSSIDLMFASIFGH